MTDDTYVGTMDPELVIRAQQGDRQAIESIVTDAHPRLFRIAVGVLGDPSTAEDATQTALLSIWRSLPRLRDPHRFDAWSYRLLVRSYYAEAGRRPSWLPDSAVDDASQPRAIPARYQPWRRWLEPIGPHGARRMKGRLPPRKRWSEQP